MLLKDSWTTPIVDSASAYGRITATPTPLIYLMGITVPSLYRRFVNTHSDKRYTYTP